MGIGVGSPAQVVEWAQVRWDIQFKAMLNASRIEAFWGAEVKEVVLPEGRRFVVNIGRVCHCHWVVWWWCWGHVTIGFVGVVAADGVTG